MATKDFAIKVLASMVDENGHCGQRGLSKKQFDVIYDAMEVTSRDEHDAGSWEGDYATINFWCIEYTGNVGPYRLTIEEHKHFNKGHSLLGIDLRPEGEYEAELEEERRLAELRDFSNSEWVAEPKKRLDLNLTLVDVYEFEGYSYSYYDDGTTYLYKFRDDDGNCIIWKTKKFMVDWMHNDMWDVVETRARVTVKSHDEYRGVKQTIINRPTFKSA